MRKLLAMLACLLWASTSEAGSLSFPDPHAYGVQVSERGHAPTPWSATSGETRIDFGTLSAFGGTPRVGRQFVLPNGDMLLVTELELTVVPSYVDGPPSTRHLREPGWTPPAGTDMRRPGFAEKPTWSDTSRTIRPSLAADDRGTVMLVARRDANIDDIGVLVAPAGTVDWAVETVPPDFVGTQVVAVGVTPGEPILLDVGMLIPAGSSGTVSASVTFEVE